MASPLHDQRPEVGWRRAVAESFRVVDQAPAGRGDVDARLGVLDDGPVFDVTADSEAGFILFGFEFVQRELADDGIGATDTGRTGRPGVAAAILRPTPASPSAVASAQP